MKFLFVFAFLFFLPLTCNELHLFPIEVAKTRERILCLKGGHCIYFFTDHTIVYLRTPPIENQTWFEWWDGVEHPQSDPRFNFSLKKWNVFSSFQLYRYDWKNTPSPHILEPLFKNSKIVSEYPYFIKNCETEEMTLCQIWSLTELGSFITHYGEERYQEGFNARIESR